MTQGTTTPLDLIARARGGFIAFQKMGAVERATRGGRVVESAVSDALAALDLITRAQLHTLSRLDADFQDIRRRLADLERVALEKKPLALAVVNTLKH